jgi:GNAT superfamily N-acetyltransferase
MTSPVSLARVASTVASSECEASLVDIQEFVNAPVCEIMVDVKPYGVDTRDDSRLSTIVQRVQEIGQDAFWGNNCLTDCTRRSRWRLNVAVAPKNVGDEVYGFIVYKIDQQNMVLHVQYIAVSSKHRRRGLGSKLLKHLQNYAAKTLTVSTVQKIACACVPDAVKFYQKHSFRKLKRIEADEEEVAGIQVDGKIEQQIPIQFHMEWKVPDKRKKMGK